MPSAFHRHAFWATKGFARYGSSAFSPKQTALARVARCIWRLNTSPATPGPTEIKRYFG